MGTAKKGIQQLAQICVAKGVQHVVVSPGSRNAPLTLAFAALKVEMLNIPDERCAAFFALGIARVTQRPVALVCTSGTAALNYAAAIAEAYYQHIPLLVLSGDRPQELIDMGEGQSIRQVGIYENFIRASFNFPQEASTETELERAQNMAAEALALCAGPIKGPVHINVPMAEPLYGQTEVENLREIPTFNCPEPAQTTESEWTELESIWQHSEKVMVLLGTFPPDGKFANALDQLAKDPRVAVLTETNANVNGEFCHHIDLALCAMENPESYQPDLLITLGENVISKKVKVWLRANKPRNHWHVDLEGKNYDTFQCLTHRVKSAPVEFLQRVEEFKLHESSSKFGDAWQQLSADALEKASEFISKSPYSDLSVLNLLHQKIPAYYRVHYANSTSVRYAQLFPHREDLSYFANRGTSGIDGCTSTAAGHAYASKAPTLLITGDVAFFYDSNAFWNKHLPEQLRVVMINNEGGNIFRIIEGPDSTEQVEEHFEARHHTSAEFLAKTYDVPYYFCDDLAGMESILPEFFGPQNGRPAILEIKTPNEVSAETMRGLFKALEHES